MSELLVLQSSPELGSDWETRNSAIRFVSWSQSKGNLWDHHDQHPPISVHFLRLQTMDHRRLEQVVDAGWNFRNQCSIAAAILWWRFASLSALSFEPQTVLRQAPMTLAPVRRFPFAGEQQDSDTATRSVRRVQTGKRQISAAASRGKNWWRLGSARSIHRHECGRCWWCG